MSTVTNPLSGLLDGLIRGHELGQQLLRAKDEHQAFLTNQALHNQQMSVQDIMNRQMLTENARPVNAGIVSQPGESTSVASPVPGLPDEQQAAPDYVRKADRSRLVKYGGSEYELMTREEQAQRNTDLQIRGQSALASAQAENTQRTRQNVLKMRGIEVPASIAQVLPALQGMRVLPEELPGLQEKALEIQGKNRVKVAPGEKVYDFNFAKPGVEPPVLATGGDPLPSDDFGKYFLPAYTAKALNKPISEVTPDDLKTLKPEQVQDAFTQFSVSKETPETKAMKEVARQTAQLHQSMIKLQMSQMPTREDANGAAQLVINHQMSPSQVTSMFGGFGPAGQAFKRMVVSEVSKIDPKFNYEEAESEFGLVKSPAFQNTVRYMDSVQESIPLVIDRAKKLANGNIRGINALLNAGKNQFNNVDLKKFQTDRTLVADEVAKILQGGGTGSGTSDMKLRQAGEILNASDSPQSIAAALEDVNQLIGYRRKALTRGTYMENSGPAAASGSIVVKAGDGSTHIFKSEQDAKAFEALVQQAGGATSR